MMTQRTSQRGAAAVWVLGSILALILAVAIIVGGYQLNWWLKGQAVNRTAKIARTSYEVQQAYREKVLADLDDIRRLDAQIADPAYAQSAAQLRAQRIQAITVACDHISRLTTSGAGVDPDIQSFHDQECAA